MTTPAPNSIVPSNVLQGPADVYTGNFGATEPANAAAVIDSTAWKFVGATDGGATLTLSQTYSNMEVDQVALPVGARRTAQSVELATTLAEATLANLRRAFNAAISAGTTFELDSQIANADPTYTSVLLKGLSPGGSPRLVIIRRALSTANVALAWKKDGKTVIPVTFSGYYVSQSIAAFKVDDTPGS